MKMYERSIKILIMLVVMWIVSLLTIVTEYRQNTTPIAIDSKMYEKALRRFKQKHHINDSIESSFKVWNVMMEADRNISLKDRLAVIKNDGYPPGMDGRPVTLFINNSNSVSRAIQAMVAKGWKDHAFNQYVSDLIPVNRTLLDYRDKSCAMQKFVDPLPKASVVICFHNEAWSTLMRTVHSVILRTPHHLLEQIILVDDASTMNHLGRRLEDEIKSLVKVVLVRVKNRTGLIRARMIGINHVKAPVIVFLDSHCECNVGWLEPLLDRIARKTTRVVSPVIDKIHDNTFEYVAQDTTDLRIGGFNWDLRFIWRSMSRKMIMKRDHNIITDPIPTPTIAGGLFAIYKEVFKEMGQYDEGYDIWGAENLELSFKTWMCGGSMEIVPCSRVGHVFRKRFPYSGIQWSSRRNAMRLAEVWLDGYKKYFYERIGNHKIDFGNVSKRIELRKKLNCRSFEWYLKNVYGDIEIPDNFAASGQIQSIGTGLCLDTSIKMQMDNMEDSIKLMPCHHQGGNQYWTYTKDGEIKRDSVCLDYIMGSLIMYICRGRAQSQVWLYDEVTQRIKNMELLKCLQAVKQPSRWGLVLATCMDVTSQKWIIEDFKVKRLTPQLQIYAKRNMLLRMNSTNV